MLLLCRCFQWGVAEGWPRSGHRRQAGHPRQLTVNAVAPWICHLNPVGPVPSFQPTLQGSQCRQAMPRLSNRAVPATTNPIAKVLTLSWLTRGRAFPVSGGWLRPMPTIIALAFIRFSTLTANLIFQITYILRSLKISQKSMSPKLTWRAAIQQVLSEAGSMHYQEITNIIIERDLVSFDGKTPARTVNNILSQSINKEIDSPFERDGIGGLQVSREPRKIG